MDGTVERTHKQRMTTCPHCGREVPANMGDMHASICAQRPEMKARILAALTSDVPGVGVKVGAYDKTSKANRVPPVSTLLRNFGGTWALVLDAFGLEVPPDNRKRRPERTAEQRRMTAKQREDAAIADVAAMDADVRAVLAHECEAAHLFTVCAVRDVPGLTINGKPCVAMMLR